MYKHVTLLFITIVSLLFFVSIGQSEILFQENFDNQPNWEPASSSECASGTCSGMPAGWSYYRSMGIFNKGTTPSGHNTINVSDEQYRGSSGKGFTVWTEAASLSSWTSDGIMVANLGQEWEELYASFYIKFSSSWVWDDRNDGMMKVFRLFHYDGGGNVFQFFSTGNSCPISLWDVKNSIKYGWRHYTTNRCDPQETNYYCRENYDWDTLFPDNKTFKQSLGDGNWHHIEFYVKLNTKTGSTWNADGINKVWIDGVLNGLRTNIEWRSSNAPENGLNYFGIGGNQHNAFANTANGEEQWYAIDDIVISTTRLTAVEMPPVEMPPAEMPPAPTINIISIK